jgi:hypothetical protein
MAELEDTVYVRCNHCMVVSSEQCLVKDDSIDSGERCPHCGQGDALMDLVEYGLIPQDAS